MCIIIITIKLIVVIVFFFFFFWETTPKGGRGDETLSLRDISKVHRFSIQGISSIQTWYGENLQANLAKQYATLLAYLREWLKDTHWKAEERSLMSNKICPKLEESLPPLERALIIISESPSSCTWFRLSSFAKTKALRTTNTSTISTDE